MPKPGVPKNITASTIPQKFQEAKQRMAPLYCLVTSLTLTAGPDCMAADCVQNYVGEKCNQVYVKCSDTHAA